MSSARPISLKGMGNVNTTITMSLDGYVAGPDDGPGKGLGDGGEVLHHWVFGGPWRYDDPNGQMAPEDQAWYDEHDARNGAVICGRSTYEAAGHWGDKNPFHQPLFVVTHRPEGEPDSREFRFVGGFEEALAKARDVAGDKNVNIMGGADVIRQGLLSGDVEDLIVIVSPVILGGGKRLFEGFTDRITLEQKGARQSPFATFLEYKVKRD